MRRQSHHLCVYYLLMINSHQRQQAQGAATGHPTTMQASPATVLTLKARILAISQFVNFKLANLEEKQKPAAFTYGK